MVTTKINKTIGLLRKLQNPLPRTALITIYNAFVRPYLDYGDVLYVQAFNLSFYQKLALNPPPGGRTMSLSHGGL